MHLVTIKQGDTARKFEDRLMIGGMPVDFGAGEVEFILTNHRTGARITQDATILTLPMDDDGTAPNVEYAPIAEDVETCGTYQQTWHVTFEDNAELTFPSDGYNAVVIEAV